LSKPEGLPDGLVQIDSEGCSKDSLVGIWNQGGLLVAEDQWVLNSHDVDPVTRGGKGQRTSWSVGGWYCRKWHAPFRPSDFLPLSRVRLLEGWQSGWDGSDMWRYAYSIWPMVSFMPWVWRFDDDWVIISMIDRQISGVICIVESPMCVCSRD
jgi:hypothetical protein